jgi:hypothetical protein
MRRSKSRRRFAHPSPFRRTLGLFLGSLKCLARISPPAAPKARSPEMRFRTTKYRPLSRRKPRFSSETHLGAATWSERGLPNASQSIMSRKCPRFIINSCPHMAQCHFSRCPYRYCRREVWCEPHSISWSMRDQQPSRWSDMDGGRVQCDGSPIHRPSGVPLGFFRQTGTRPLADLPYRRSARSSLPFCAWSVERRMFSCRLTCSPL